MSEKNDSFSGGLNGLFICDHARKVCHADCHHGKPHIHDEYCEDIGCDHIEDRTVKCIPCQTEWDN